MATHPVGLNGLFVMFWYRIMDSTLTLSISSNIAFIILSAIIQQKKKKRKEKKRKEKKRKERGPAEQLHTQTLNYWAVLRYVSRNAAQPDHRVQGLINYCAQFRVTAERAAANALSQCVMTAG
jgi:hypothetical protein